MFVVQGHLIPIELRRLIITKWTLFILRRNNCLTTSCHALLVTWTPKIAHLFYVGRLVSSSIRLTYVSRLYLSTWWCFCSAEVHSLKQIQHHTWSGGTAPRILKLGAERSLIRGVGGNNEDQHWNWSQHVCSVLYICQCGDASPGCEQQVKADLAVSTQYGLPAVFLTDALEIDWTWGRGGVYPRILNGIEPQA